MFPIGDENEPGRGPAIITIGLIAANVIVFLLFQGAGGNEAFTYGWSAVPLEITTGVDFVTPQQVVISGQTYLVPQAPGPEPIQLTLLSAMFMHAGWLHLGGNMLFLWVFGDNVEHRAGRVLYLVAYLAAGIVGSLAQIWTGPDSPIPTLGASGAISGVLGAYIVLFPRNRVTVFLFRIVTQVPALVAIGLWIVLQLVSLMLPVLAFFAMLSKGLALAYALMWLIALFNGMLRGSWLGYMNYTIEVSSDEDRTVYLLLNSLTIFPFAFLSFFAGMMADAWGYTPLFVISSVTALCALGLSIKLKHPANSGKKEAD
jgi:membrane associated rhomboid family serine protease